MIGVLGISHKTASQDIRELFSFSKEQIIPFAELVQQKTEVSEIVVLSTCNRTEIYYYQSRTCSKKSSHTIVELLHEFKQIETYYENCFYQLFGLNAVNHLFEVISGIDSVVKGEYQIVSQIKEAYMYCTEAALTDAVLMRLFQKSFETSKRVRTETAMQQGPTSVSYVAVDLCSKLYDNLSEKSVLFIGSGETGSLALLNMKKKGVKRTFITNRTHDKALALANEYGGLAVSFEELHHYIPKSDIVIVATGAQNHLICKTDVEASLLKRNYEPQVYIDLSVPRNIDKSISELEKIRLFGVDDLQEVVDSSADKRVQSVEQARIIIREMTEEYINWFETLTLRPLIKTITTNLQKIRENEIAAYVSEDEQKYKVIEEYTNRLTQKYIGTIIKSLKEVSKNNSFSHSLNIIEDLFKFEN